MSKLTFKNLSSLIPSMKSFSIEKEHFVFNYAKQIIDCVFCLGSDKHELLVAIHKINYGFSVTITQNRVGDYIAELMDDDYRSFCKALNLSFHNDGFNSNTLLKLLSSNVPIKSSGIKISYQTMQQYTKCRQVEESDKIYFMGWETHKQDGRTARNFDKTEFYFGPTVANHCRKYNISSKWTYIQEKGCDFYSP